MKLISPPPSTFENFIKEFPLIRRRDSLGVVLLELGLWQPLSSFDATTNLRNDPEVLREHLLKIARNELPGQVGKIYANVVIECLKVGADTSDSTVQELLCWKVAAALDACTA